MTDIFPKVDPNNQIVTGDGAVFWSQTPRGEDISVTTYTSIGSAKFRFTGSIEVVIHSKASAAIAERIDSFELKPGDTGHYSYLQPGVGVTQIDVKGKDGKPFYGILRIVP